MHSSGNPEWEVCKKKKITLFIHLTLPPPAKIHPVFLSSSPSFLPFPILRLLSCILSCNNTLSLIPRISFCSHIILPSLFVAYAYADLRYWEAQVGVAECGQHSTPLSPLLPFLADAHGKVLMPFFPLYNSHK